MPTFEADILKVISRTNDVSSYRFSNPKNIVYQAGQYLIVTLNSEDKKIIHPFSISNSPTEEGYLEITTKLSNSSFKKTLHLMKLGEKASIDGPYGNFILEDKKQICMLAGGLGITPFRSMIKYCIDKHLETNIVLFYSCRKLDDVIFRDELNSFQSQNASFRVIYVLEEADKDYAGYTGYINANVIMDQLHDYEERQFYICGPPIMVRAMENILSQIGVKKEMIKMENFSGY